MTDQFNTVCVQLLLNGASNVIRSEDGMGRQIGRWVDFVSHAAFGYKAGCHQSIIWLGVGWHCFLLKVFGDQVKHQPRDVQLATGSEGLLVVPRKCSDSHFIAVKGFGSLIGK